MRFYKTETLPTFNVQHPVNSTYTKLTAIMALTYPKKYKEDIDLEI